MVQTNCVRPKLIVVTGATATGKTAASIRLAQRIGGEIVGCDSMQIYRGMDIGTGKVTVAETCGIRHHMIDVADPDEGYSVGRYKEEAESCMRAVRARGAVPILTGGTGLYIRALLSGMNLGETGSSPGIRRHLEDELAAKGAEALYERLCQVDPAAASRIHINDTKRVIRALEIFLSTGVPKSRAVSSLEESPYDFLFFVLGYGTREKLYKKIDARVDEMFAKGLEREVSALYRYRHCPSMQAIGYKELVAYYDGLCSLQEAKALIKKNSRRYAKRQMTFLRGLPYDKLEIDMERDTVDAYRPVIEHFLENR